MPAKGTSKQKDRTCLVCGEATRIAHFGMDVCRACAVFYRRARQRDDLSCRSKTGRCPIQAGAACKRCRLDRLRKLLPQASLAAEQRVAAAAASRQAGASLAAAAVPPVVQSTPRPLLDRLRAEYKTMCYARLLAELHARPADSPHPMHISVDEGPFFLADVKTLSLAIRALLSASLNLASEAFPDFKALPQPDKWTLALNFAFRFRVFEGCLRANRHFPNDPDEYMASFTTHFNPENYRELFSSAPATADVAGALKYTSTRVINTKIRDGRAMVARANLRDEEVLVVLALMLWSADEEVVSDEIARIGERYRAALLAELAAFYREELRLDSCAERMGELMMLVQAFQRSAEFKEHLEILRMYGVIEDDNDFYTLQQLCSR